MDKENIIIGLFAFTIVALLVVSIYGSCQEQNEWESFYAAHKCKVVGKEKGHTSTGVAPIIGGNGGVGVIVASTPSKTGYLCDDGITYWR